MKSTDMRFFTLPNIITLLGLTSGSIAVFYALNNPTKLYYASYFIFLAMVFDFLDGFFARLLNQRTKIGKELDSLADIVNFGVAPAVVVFQLLKIALKVKEFNLNLPVEQILVLLSPILLILFAALRLARYNVDKNQTEHFIGIPTPAVAAFFASLPLVKDFDPGSLLVLYQWLDLVPFKVEMSILALEIFVMESQWFYLPLVLFFSVLMIGNFPMFSLKFGNLNFKTNSVRYVFLIFSIIFLGLMQSFAIPLVIFMYIALSAAQNIKHKLTQKKLPKQEEDLHLNDGFHLALSLPELKMYSAEIEILPMSEVVQKRNEEILREIRSEYKDIIFNIKTGNFITMRVEAESEDVAKLRVGNVCANILTKHGLKDLQYNVHKLCN